MLCSMLVVLPASSAVAAEKLSEFEPMEGLKVLLSTARPRLVASTTPLTHFDCI
jgi:hypothetical protein